LATRVAEDSLSASWLAVRLGVEPLRLEAMRRAGELISYRPEGARERYYPLWQFDEDWQPLPIVARLVREARERGLGENRLYETLSARSGLSAGGGRLADSLREGRDEHALEAIRLARPS
jgi:hypothetical protein